MEVSRRNLLIIFIYLLVHSVNAQLKNPCNHNEFRCADESGCLSTEKLCNGVEDCLNGEDEKGNSQWDCTRSTLQTECSLQELKCRFGGCIPRSKKCDGIPDCWGGNDEARDLCVSKPFKPGIIKVSSVGGTTTTTTASTPSHVYIQATQTPQHVYVKPTQTEEYPIHKYQPTQTTSVSTWQPSPSPVSTVSQNLDVSPPESTAIRIQPQRRGCPPLPKEPGVTISCYSARFRKDFDCTKLRSPNGTEVTYSCAKYWGSPKTGPSSTTRICKENNSWSKRNTRWKCSLTCGIKPDRPIGFIVQGRTASPYDWPWHVALYNEDPPNSGKFNYFCGGTLISLRAVLTAAHCATGHRSASKRTDPIIAIPGKYHRTFDKNDEKDKYAQQRRVVDIDVNEYYNPINFEGDIAIMWLDEDVEITDGVRPGCLPSKRDDVVHGDDELSLGILPGWGRSNNREYPEDLQEADLPVIDINTCKRAHPTLAMLIRITTFCAGHRNGTTACDGDSGGGLVFDHPQEKGKVVVKGIVSAGIQRRGGGCDENYYTIFTKVPHYRDWIDMLLSAKNNF